MKEERCGWQWRSNTQQEYLDGSKLDGSQEGNADRCQVSSCSFLHKPEVVSKKVVKVRRG